MACSPRGVLIPGWAASLLELVRGRRRERKDYPAPRQPACHGLEGRGGRVGHARARMRVDATCRRIPIRKPRQPRAMGRSIERAKSCISCEAATVSALGASSMQSQWSV
jgi:hypothetical protein